MATIGNLWINIKSNTTGLDKGLNKSKKSLGGFKGALAGIGVAMAAAFAVKLIKDFAGAISDAMGRIDEIAKFAKSIDVATESVQVFRYAAELTGVSVGEADKAFGKLVKNVGESSMGIGTATDAFKELGLNADELSRMNADEMFGVIADSIMQVDNRAQQASLAYDIFGRAGMKLLNTMELGSKGMKEMREEMESMGVLFSSIDAEGVERANDAMTTLGVVIDSIFQQVAIQLAPAIEELAAQLTAMASDPAFRDAIDDMTESIKGFAEAVIDLKDKHAGEVVKDVLLWFGEGMLGITDKADDAKESMDEWNESMKEQGILTMHQALLNNKAAALAEETARKAKETKIRLGNIEEAKKFAAELEHIQTIFKTFSEKDRLLVVGQQIETLSKDFDLLALAVHNGVVESEAGKIALLELSREIQLLQGEKLEILNPEQVDALGRTRAELEEIGVALTESLQTPTEIFATKLAEIDNLLAEGVISIETYGRALAELKDSIPDEAIEVNLVTKGVVEGIQSAMGTIKIGGEVSKTDQLASDALETQKKIEDVMTAVKDNTKSLEQETSDVASSTKTMADLLSKTITVDVVGLKNMMDTTWSEIKSLSTGNSMDKTETLLKDSIDVNKGGFTSIVNEIKNLSSTTSSPLV